MTPRREAGWLQINAQLERPDGQAEPSARAVFEGLGPLIRGWRRERLLRWFYFLRKPPDMRLRFYGPDPQLNVQPGVAELLASLKRMGMVRRFFESIYEPEVHLFGGPSAMACVHAYFDADTRGWMELDQLAASNRRTLSPEHLALGVLNDLFLQTLGERSEVWDVWVNLGGEDERGTERELPEVEIFGIDELIPLVSVTEGKELKRYLRANRALSGGLKRLWSRGSLCAGLRGILPFIALFHFNRHGLDAARRLMLSRAMSRAWNPRRGMRGV